MRFRGTANINNQIRLLPLFTQANTLHIQIYTTVKLIFAAKLNRSLTTQYNSGNRNQKIFGEF